uniref:Uncharacterized protein n=1 Tax=Trieres chinensis TaxID=1514140 RepID=A0A7S1ZYK7_TRICV
MFEGVLETLVDKGGEQADSFFTPPVGGRVGRRVLRQICLAHSIFSDAHVCFLLACLSAIVLSLFHPPVPKPTTILSRASPSVSVVVMLCLSIPVHLSPTVTPHTTIFMSPSSLSSGIQIPCFSCGAMCKKCPGFTLWSTSSTRITPDPSTT